MERGGLNKPREPRAAVLGEPRRASHSAQSSAGQWGNHLQGYRHINVKMGDPLYQFNASSLKDSLVSLDIKVKFEIEVSICIYLQII